MQEEFAEDQDDQKQEPKHNELHGEDNAIHRLRGFIDKLRDAVLVVHLLEPRVTYHHLKVQELSARANVNVSNVSPCMNLDSVSFSLVYLSFLLKAID